MSFLASLVRNPNVKATAQVALLLAAVFVVLAISGVISALNSL